MISMLLEEAMMDAGILSLQAPVVIWSKKIIQKEALVALCSELKTFSFTDCTIFSVEEETEAFVYAMKVLIGRV